MTNTYKSYLIANLAFTALGSALCFVFYFTTAISLAAFISIGVFKFFIDIYYKEKKTDY
ncbi:DUF1270 family protein [Staphylococcus simiae]|uniref:DUF1270 family protein n=1 Tax=Staphylococcus simiae TaxID=308354 RepID=UPI001A97BC0F|nr:DUF1270 family protein [Staphylococcus simiae]MBO1199095.1 DUF1270 family protein [Staphylococcus simiae]MBO1201197.1 DUF1270 family protein [Staphylococcus simiae]MBO1203345.1 DUF1270 family protein [Staphylococcus simiae]MBO1210873.1 DUF1270 family protein [Staphylococcus simiae]MBO1229533.1 DUF1270 family protein [Staphylococcus simiae]